MSRWLCSAKFNVKTFQLWASYCSTGQNSNSRACFKIWGCSYVGTELGTCQGATRLSLNAQCKALVVATKRRKTPKQAYEGELIWRNLYLNLSCYSYGLVAWNTSVFHVVHPAISHEETANLTGPIVSASKARKVTRPTSASSSLATAVYVCLVDRLSHVTNMEKNWVVRGVLHFVLGMQQGARDESVGELRSRDASASF